MTDTWLLDRLGLPGELPEQLPLPEAGVSVIPCPKTGPDRAYRATVKERRRACRREFEDHLAAWCGKNYSLVPQVAEKWWPNTGVSS